MAVLKGHEVLSPVNWGDGLVPVGSFVETGILSDRDVADLTAAAVLGPEEMREFPDDGVSDVLLVVRADRPASNGNGDGEQRHSGSPIAGPGAAAATAAPITAPGAATATVKAGRTPPAAPKKPATKKPS